LPSTVKCTTAFESPDPDNVGSAVILSVAKLPVSVFSVMIARTRSDGHQHQLE
jgi:hypothetical protein